MSLAKDIAAYYNTTQNHYEKWWGLSDFMSLHYGIWEENTKDFGEALVNTNKHLLAQASVQSTDNVLDAGCGVGGAAIFIHEQTGANVTGISLSERQLKTARENALEKRVEGSVNFHEMNFCNTTFEPDSFDVVWACESVCHAEDKLDFLKEAYRILKPNGRLVLFDFFLTEENQTDKKNWIDKWAATWAVPNFSSTQSFLKQANVAGFSKIENRNYTPNVVKSAKRMYYASLAGALPSELYNLTHPNVSKFAKTHYRCGYFQYKALKQNLWQYQMITAVKM